MQGCMAARIAQSFVAAAAAAAAAAAHPSPQCAARRLCLSATSGPGRVAHSAAAAALPLCSASALLHSKVCDESDSKAGTVPGEMPNGVNVLKHQRCMSARERLGMLPIVREDRTKKKTQPVISMYQAEWKSPTTLTAEPQVPPVADEAHAAAEAVAAGIPHQEEAVKGMDAASAAASAVVATPVPGTLPVANLAKETKAESVSENNETPPEKKKPRIGEIKDAKLVFSQAWANIESRYGKANLTFPKEIIWLMGAPGSGKGTHTPFLVQARGITNMPISMSSLLSTAHLTTPSSLEDVKKLQMGGETSAESTAMKAGEGSKMNDTTEPAETISTQELAELKDKINKGQMISDVKVVEILLHALLDCDPTVGVIVDGFPRTEIQVECLKLFYDKMHHLRRFFWKSAMRDRFPRPVFRICVLYVDEEVSVQRQLARGQTIRAHNMMVRRSGQGELMEERVTDYDETLIRARYQIFKEHYGALLKLAKIFPFHLINALGSIEDVMHIILKEFEYQSSLELDEATYEAIAHIPVAAKIGVHARQDLLRRLEEYQVSNRALLQAAVKFIDDGIMPVVIRHAISGSAMIRTEDDRLTNQLFADMIMDVLSERGYHVTFEMRTHVRPVRIDPETWNIITESHPVYAFIVRFPYHNIQPVEQKLMPQSPIQFSPFPPPMSMGPQQAAEPAVKTIPSQPISPPPVR